MFKKMLGLRSNLAQQMGDAVMSLAGRVPSSKRSASDDPSQQADEITRAACKKAAAISAGLAIPPGPVGLMTVIPDLTLIWNLQAQMVADIAAVYGKSASVGREHMLWCLFKHTGAQAFRDFVVRGGQRWLIKKASLGAIQSAAQTIGIKLTQRTISKSAARFVPLLGAVGVGLYAYRDTREVARAAVALFSDLPAADTGE